MAKLVELVELNPRLAEPLDRDEPVSFVPMSAVIAETATTTTSSLRSFLKAKWCSSHGKARRACRTESEACRTVGSRRTGFLRSNVGSYRRNRDHHYKFAA